MADATRDLPRAIDLGPAPFLPVELSNNKGPGVSFDGRLLHEGTTQNRARTKTRWGEIRLWETPAGAWIAEDVACSEDDGEVDITKVGVFRDPIGEDRHFLVMDFFGWNHLARAMASKLKWNLVMRVE